MVASQQQQAIIRNLAAAMSRLGYRGDLLQTAYSFRDWFSDGSSTSTAELAAFGQTPVSYSTACIGVVAADRLAGVDLVRAYRSLGAPIIFEVEPDQVTPWRVSVHPTGADRLHPFGIEAVDRAFADHADVWSPEGILRAKNIQPVGPRQLDFLDLGLVPALEEHIRQKLDPILKKGLAVATEEYKRVSSRSADEEHLFQAAFWLLAGKVFHDREHSDFTDLSQTSDPDEVLSRVGHHYGEAIPTRLMNKAARVALQQAIWGSIDFRNLSVEILADIWSTTLVTPELRKRLGIHSTPRALAKYIVDRLPFEGIPEEDRFVLEPCCGSARFLIAALQRLRLLLPATKPANARHTYFTRMLSGYELDPFGIEISRLGLMLADYPNPDGWDLHCDNVFTAVTFEDRLRQARVVLCNPPFEDLDEQARVRYGVETPRQPAALLSRVLQFLNPKGILGFVLPRTFLDGRSYRSIREMLVPRFSEIEILSLPERAFTHAQADTAILLASQPRRDGTHSIVTHRKVEDADWCRFQSFHAVSREDKSAGDAVTAARSIAVSDLADLWRNLSRHETLGRAASIHRGIEWCRPILKSFPGGAENRADLVRESPADGFRLGVPPGSTFGIFVRPHLQYLSLRNEDRRGNAADLPWDLPKVIVNKTRRSRGRWRLAAFPDIGGIVCYQTFIAVWPLGQQSVTFLAAVLNGPIANAYIASHEHGRDVTKDTLSNVPIPSYSPELEQQINQKAAQFMDALRSHDLPMAWTCLVELDASITTAYGLSTEDEKALLQYLYDGRRPVPDGMPWNGYTPSSPRNGITFEELLAVSRDWEAVNQRRCDLVEKKLQSGLSATETSELLKLQALADTRVQMFAPLPLDELDELLEAMGV
jgi:hypothetical protein